MGALRKIRHAIERAVVYLQRIQDLIEHGNQRLDVYQKKLADAEAKLQENIDNLQAVDVVALQEKLDLLTKKLEELQADLAELD